MDVANPRTSAMKGYWSKRGDLAYSVARVEVRILKR